MPQWETRSHRLRSRHVATAIQLQRQGWGEVHGSSRLVEGLSEGPGALQDVASSLFPGASSIDPSQGELKGLVEEARICLLPPSLLMTTTPLAVGRITSLNVPH